MLSRFHLIPERLGETDGQNCYINIVRQCADARASVCWRASVSVLTRDKNSLTQTFSLCSRNNIDQWNFFYRAMLCIARTILSQDIRLSDRLSHASILSNLLNILSNFFYLRVVTPSRLVAPYQTLWQYSDGNSMTGASNAGRYEKPRFSANVSLYVRNIQDMATIIMECE